MISVFYDGKCGLCRREIGHYQRIAPAGRFIWHDITVDPSCLQAHGISYDDGLKLLHAQDAQGTLHIGADAFILIWRQIHRWRLLAALIALPGIHVVAGFVYTRFAAWKFKRLTHCQLAHAEAIAESEQQT